MSSHTKLRSAALLLSGLIAACWPALAFFENRFTAEDDFSSSSVMSGVKASKADCVKGKADVVWTDPQDTGKNQACIKYWHAGLQTNTARVIVFLHGDVTVGNQVSASYLPLTSDRLNDLITRRYASYKTPYIYLGRPGTHGSSGDHGRRRTLEEVLLVNAALDQLKAQYSIEEFVIAGQSGGGFLTAALLNFRSDIYCAAPTSAPSSPRIRYLAKGLTRDTTGRSDSYEPTEDKPHAKPHEKLRVVILGDEQDSNVIWPSQIVLSPYLDKHQIQHIVLKGEASDKDHHGLNNSANIVASWCAQGRSLEDINERFTRTKPKG